jgi:hypothetical protein
MNDDRPPTPESLDHLYAEIVDLIAAVGDTERQMGIEADGYGKCVEAMWRAGFLATEYVASQLGVTGFQHSIAMLRLYGKAMHIDGPFMMVKVQDALYPQYDLPGRLAEFLDEQRGWLAEQARAKLAEYEAAPTHTWTDGEGVERTTPTAASRVVQHWRDLAAAVPA